MLIADGKLRPADTLTRPERELSEDTLRVMAITFSDLDGPETLDGLLKQRGSDPVYAHLLYEGLGNLYISKERFQDAALAFEALAKRRPDDRYRALVADAHDRGVPEGRIRIAGARRQAGRSSSVTRSARRSGRTAPLRMRRKLPRS